MNFGATKINSSNDIFMADESNEEKGQLRRRNIDTIDAFVKIVTQMHREDAARLKEKRERNTLGNCVVHKTDKKSKWKRDDSTWIQKIDLPLWNKTQIVIIWLQLFLTPITLFLPVKKYFGLVY